ncbi:MAG: von Willebrand factor type A domain-containing protein [Anaerolineales bacterium]|nr:von Willebrand factor type A domain-containing protein [Anaerolineales bacterium]
MKTLRKAVGLSVLFVLLFLSACGGGAATEAPLYTNDYEEAPAATEAPAMSEPFVSQNPAEAQNPSLSGVPTQTSNNEPYDMFFEDYGVNPSIDTEDDNLSTFALDVDTGSYTVMRNYLNDGNLPPADSVRVEEYVNYFVQGYAIPPAHQSFSISMDAAPSPFTETERYDMLRVGIQGYDVSDEDRKDAALTFVIDVSGSMDMDNRLELVKRSLELLVEQLHRNDTVSIVVYGSSARVVLDPTPGSDTGEILRAIRRLEPEGATNAEDGIRLGYRMAMQAYNPNGINRVILCSDGVANVGNTEAEVILSEIKGYVDEGITMATFGFGMDNYNDINGTTRG